MKSYVTLPGCKIPSEIDNPIDHLLYQICELISDPLHKMGVSPNMITLVGLGLGLIGAYLLWKQYYFLAALMFFIGYFCDCLDGYLARKYKTTSRFGDVLDHGRDFIVNLLYFGLIFFYLPRWTWRLIFICVVVVVYVLQWMYFGCQEQVSAFRQDSQVLETYHFYCPSQNSLGWLRFFGPATLALIFCFFVILLHFIGRKTK